MIDASISCLNSCEKPTWNFAPPWNFASLVAKWIIDNFVPIGRLSRRTQDNEEENDSLRSGECEKCKCVERSKVEENEKEVETPANEDGERVEGKER